VRKQFDFFRRLSLNVSLQPPEINLPWECFLRGSPSLSSLRPRQATFRPRQIGSAPEKKQKAFYPGIRWQNAITAISIGEAVTAVQNVQNRWVPQGSKSFTLNQGKFQTCFLKKVNKYEP